jgi:hypothetical protein
LPKLAVELETEPMVIGGSEIARKPNTSDPFSTRPAPKLKKPAGRVSINTLLFIGLGVALIAAAVAGAVLWGAGGDRSHGGGDQPVAVVIERQVGAGPGADGPSEQGSDAGSEEPDGTSTTQPAIVPRAIDAGPRRDASRPGSQKRPTKNTLTAAEYGRLVTRTLIRRRAELLRCFQLDERAREVDVVRIRVEIREDGTVRGASIDPSQIQAARSGRCLIGVATSTRFPRHEDDLLVFRIPLQVQAR